MPEPTIEQQAKKLFSDHLGFPYNLITMETKIEQDMGADSLDKVELVMAFEEEFGVTISDDEAEKINTVLEAVEYIKSNQH